MTQIPRKPTFPSHMVQKLRQKIQSDVQEDVIPVSTGIYSYEKLKNKLEAIPKPEIQNYEDKIFFEIIEDKLGVVDRTGEKCNSCDEEYHMKKNPPIMCNFCGFWSCTNCIPLRKRSHPLSKDGSGKRYNVCQRCDTKYLNLQLGHSYVENRTLIEQAIVKTSQQLQTLINECQQYQELLAKSKQTFEKNKFKISQLRKEKLQLTKEIKNKMPQEIKLSQDRQEALKVKFVHVHLKHKEWMEFSEIRRKKKEEKQRQTRQQLQQQEAERVRVLEKQKLKRQQEQQEMEEIQRRERQQRQQQSQQERQKQQRLQRQQQEQDQTDKLKLKKSPSLQQNPTFSLNLTYSNSETQLQKKKSNTNEYGGYDNCRRQESEEEDQTIRSRKATRTSKQRNQKEEQRQKDIKQSNDKVYGEGQQSTHFPISQQQQQFSDYFRQSSQQFSLTKQHHPETGYNLSYQTPVKQMYSLNGSTGVNENQSVNENESILVNKLSEKINDTEEEVNNFSFNDRAIPSNKNYEQEREQQSWNYMSRNNSRNNQSAQQQEQQYTFSNNFNTLNREQNQDLNREQNQVEEIPITSSKPHLEAEEQDQNSKLSFVDEWYVNKSHKNNTSNNNNSGYLTNTTRQHSSLSSTLNVTSTLNLASTQKGKKTQQQLQEECTKSTSQLDEQQLQVARYSLIKAARDSAVEQRQRKKIYQKSIYESDQAPYDQQQAEGVGEIKKCQCTIY